MPGFFDMLGGFFGGTSPAQQFGALNPELAGQLAGGLGTQINNQPLDNSILTKLFGGGGLSPQQFGALNPELAGQLAGGGPLSEGLNKNPITDRSGGIVGALGQALLQQSGLPGQPDARSKRVKPGDEKEQTLQERLGQASKLLASREEKRQEAVQAPPPVVVQRPGGQTQFVNPFQQFTIRELQRRAGLRGSI